MRTFIARLCGNLAVLQVLGSPFGVNAETTNQMSMEFEPDPAQYLERRPPPSEAFWIRFNQELLFNDDVIRNGLGPSSAFKWAQVRERSGYGFHDSLANSGKKAMFRLFEDSAKETALATLPVEEMQEKGRAIGNFFASAFRGILGNTVEERAYDANIEDQPEFNASEQSWWKKLQKDKTIRYGIRPFRVDPYIYLGARAGHWGPKDLPVFILDNRLSYRAFDSARARSSLIMPLDDGLYLSASFTVDMFGDNSKEKMSSSVRLEKSINRRNSAVYAGYRIEESHSLLFVGLFSKW